MLTTKIKKACVCVYYLGLNPWQRKQSGMANRKVLRSELACRRLPCRPPSEPRSWLGVRGKFEQCLRSKLHIPLQAQPINIHMQSITPELLSTNHSTFNLQGVLLFFLFYLCYHLARIRANDVHAEDAVCLLVCKDFDRSLVITNSASTAIGCEWEASFVVLNASLLKLFFRSVKRNTSRKHHVGIRSILVVTEHPRYTMLQILTVRQQQALDGCKRRLE